MPAGTVARRQRTELADTRRRIEAHLVVHHPWVVHLLAAHEELAAHVLADSRSHDTAARARAEELTRVTQRAYERARAKGGEGTGWRG